MSLNRAGQFESVGASGEESPGKAGGYCRRRGFTLVELLITISIIGIMASMILFALFAAQEQARVQKTRALIAKLNNVVRARYETYRTRRLPFPQVNDTWDDVNQNGTYDPMTDKITYDANNNGAVENTTYPVGSPVYSARMIARMRFDMLRDYMRMEMPDRWSDVYDGPASHIKFNAYKAVPRPAVSEAYYRKYQQVTGVTGRSAGTELYQNAECLYMIVMEAVAQEGDAREVFKATDVADTDGDGFPEFIDAWRTPIRFLRWAPGFISEVQNPVRGKITGVNGMGQSITITATNQPGDPNRFSTSPGDYLNGTLAVIDSQGGTGPERLHTQRMGRITGYTYDAPTLTATFTLTTPSYTMQPVFQDPPQPGDKFVVMPPDPFDPRGLYPDYSANHSVPTFALYPLVYSAGPDKAFGIVADYEDKSVMPLPECLHYVNEGLNPFFVSRVIPPTLSFGLMMGSSNDQDSNEPGFYLGCWNDNIHNHQLNMR